MKVLSPADRSLAMELGSHMYRILFLSLEFSASTFSGNGVYAQSQVRALASLGHEVFVLSARPTGSCSSRVTQGAKHLEEAPVSRWGKLDSSAPWEEYAAGAGAAPVVEAIKAFQPEVVMVVDWSALPAWHAIKAQLGGADVPMVYLNYRVFTRTEQGAGLELVRRLEAQAMQEAVETVVLSRSDQQYLQEHVGSTAGDGPSAGGGQPAGRAPKVLLCALREDMRRLPAPADVQQLPDDGSSGADAAGTCSTASAQHEAQHTSHAHSTAATMSHSESMPALPPAQAPAPSQGTGQHLQDIVQGQQGGAAAQGPATSRADGLPQRPYLTCVVRLVPEKEPNRFVALVEALAARGTLERLQLTPLLVGASHDEYAQAIKQRLKAAAPASVILESFMGPEMLAEVYSRTRLNVHPPLYDAFGMTIVEAASQGAPSLVHDGDGAVGAADLLRASHKEVHLVDFSKDPAALAQEVDELLRDPARMAALRAHACQRARSWDEAANASALIAMTKEAIAAAKF